MWAAVQMDWTDRIPIVMIPTSFYWFFESDSSWHLKDIVNCHAKSRVVWDCRQMNVDDYSPQPNKSQNETMYEYRQLGQADAPAIHNHFLSMSAEDRRSRFRQTLNDESLIKYAKSLNFLRDAFIGCFFEHGLVGIAQINMYSDKDSPVGELALSVDAAHRRAGVGEALIHYMKAYVRLRGIVEFSLTTTKCNKAMVALARKIGSEPFEEDGEVVAKIVLNHRDDRYAMRKSSLPEFKVFENTNEKKTKLVVMLLRCAWRCLAVAAISRARYRGPRLRRLCAGNQMD